ncbi:hypothetical protein KQI65_08100 [bacterium]|nr:hypothetical protein [bacterium]
MRIHSRLLRSLTGLLLLPLFVAIVLLFPAGSLHAQTDINVTTQVLPPYSPYLSDYVTIENKVVITLVNTTPAPKNVRLIGRIEGGNNITITIPQNYIPPQGIQLGPNEARALMGAELADYLNPDILQFQGISKAEVVQGNGLPEGDYSFCVQAVDYQNGTPLSLPAPSGCAYFSITHFEPPEILQPTCNQATMASSPQNLVMSWTIPAGAPPQNIEYVLTMTEMFPQDIDPNQAVLAATDPPFFQVVVQSNSFLYGPNAPQLESGKRYAWRVTARERLGSPKMLFKNNGHSGACYFLWQEGQLVENQGEEEDEEDVDIDEQYAEDCDVLNCAPQPLATGPASNKTYKVGDEVQIGYFVMTITSLSNPSASGLSGEGTIDAPIFHTQLKTTFQGLQVNAENKVFNGNVNGAYDPGSQVNQAMKDFSNNMDQITGEAVKSVSDFVKGGQKYVENFVDMNVQGLPFAWSKMLSGDVQLVNIVAVEFAPDGARLNAVFDMPIPEANNKILAFAQKNVCFHPTGLSVEGLQKLTMLGNDYTFDWGPSAQCTIEAAGGNNGGTYVAWNCDGFQELQIEGNFVFDNSMIEKAEGGGQVTASFVFNGSAWGDLLGEIDMDPFVIAGMQGMEMDIDEVVLDLSDIRNPQNISYPEGYNGTQGMDWRGFYFKNITLTLPDYLKKGNEPVQISLSNALINKTGFTGAVTVQPVFETDEGNLGGWAFSIDKFELAFVDNALVKGAFQGELEIPIASTGLGYSCLLSNSNQGLQTEFEVESLDDIDVPMWGATLTLQDGSAISVETVQNDVTVQAILSGELTIDKSFPEMKNVAVKIPDVEFKDLTIQNKKPYVTAEYFKFASPEKSFAGFPVSIDAGDGIGLHFQGDDMVGLMLGFQIGLDGNGESAISGGTSFTIWGKMQMVDGKQKWVIDKPQLNSINIEASVAACDIMGEINLYSGDEKFGDGFRGALKVTFRPVVEVSATVQFGSTTYKNGGERYRYWYFDGMARIGTGIPIFTGLGIYGIGGGAWYHMSATNDVPGAAQLEGDKDNVDGFDVDSPGQTSSGVVYEPRPDIAFGMKATIVLGTMPEPKAFNGDITLEIEFFEGGGLKKVGFHGNGYFVQALDPKNRPGEGAVIVASADFVYDNEFKRFDGLISIAFNLKAGDADLITGGGDAAFHVSKDKWFIKFGTPDSPLQLNVLDLLAIKTYLMAGKNSLGPMPDLPTSPVDYASELPSFNEDNPRASETENGTGFAMGQQLSIDTGELKFLIFYAQLVIDFGFDVSILKTNAYCEEVGGKMGFNGWYATGQVYTAIIAGVGIDINLWFVQKKIVILEVGLIAALKAGLPKPTWMMGEVKGYYNVFDGLLTGHVNFKFRTGTYCNPNEGDPFEGLKVISDVVPTGTETDCFAFPEAAFNLPVGTDNVISVEIIDENQDPKTVSFRFELKKFEIRKVNGNQKVAGSWAKYNDDLTAQFEAEEMFDELTQYRIDVEVYGDRKVNGQWIRIKECQDCEKDYVETETVNFTTDKAPENFRNDLIIETVPGRMQRYFPKGSTAQGFINFKQYPSNIPQLQPEDPDFKYSYVARFQEVKSGSEVIGTTPIQWENSGSFKGVKFGLPSLKPTTLYIIQIVRKRVPKGGGGMVNNMNIKSNEQQKSGSNFEQKKSPQYLGKGQWMKVRRSRFNAIRLADNEFLVYQLAFKTSKYHTYDSKLKDFYDTVDKMERRSSNQNSLAYNSLEIRFKGDEAFDPYDINEYSYKKGSITHYVEPAFKAEAKNIEGGNQPWWAWLRNKYFEYSMDDQYINSVYINSDMMGQGLNPRTRREYPSAGAYRPGSRITHDTRLSQVKFPLWATDLRYTGSGPSNKLTNQEINAVYWKDYVPPSQGKSIASKLNFKTAKVVKLNPMLNMGNMNIKQNEFHYLVLRYDVPAVIMRDRDLIVDELIYRYNTSLMQHPPFWSFMKYNCPPDIADDLGVQNPNHWSMRFGNGTKIPITFHVRGKNYGTDRTYNFNP